jgi:hypothetical protein
VTSAVSAHNEAPRRKEKKAPPQQVMWVRGPLQTKVKPLSETKCVRIQSWVDNTDQGSSSLGNLLDPQDHVGHERRRNIVDMGCDFRNPVVVAREQGVKQEKADDPSTQPQTLAQPVVAGEGPSASSSDAGTSVADQGGGSSQVVTCSPSENSSHHTKQVP